MKLIVLITELLTDPMKGIYTQWIYYNDGTVEERKVPKGPIIMPKEIY
jgi:hypothetical protein